MRYTLIGIILVVLFSISALPVAHAQEVIYFMRHAEQVLDVEDPPLTEVGHRRAEAWASILRNAGIKVVYTSKKNALDRPGSTLRRPWTFRWRACHGVRLEVLSIGSAHSTPTMRS